MGYFDKPLFWTRLRNNFQELKKPFKLNYVFKIQ